MSWVLMVERFESEERMAESAPPWEEAVQWVKEMLESVTDVWEASVRERPPPLWGVGGGGKEEVDEEEEEGKEEEESVTEE